MGDSGHLNKVGNLNRGGGRVGTPQERAAGGRPAYSGVPYISPILCPTQPARATRPGGTQRCEDSRHRECPRPVCGSEAFPQGAVPPASARIRWEGVWSRCGVLGVLGKKVRGCLGVAAGPERSAGGWGQGRGGAG